MLEKQKEGQVARLVQEGWRYLAGQSLLSLSGEVTRVWWAWPIAESMGLTLTVLFFLRNYRQRIKPLYEY